MVQRGFVISQSSGGKRKLRLIHDFSVLGHNKTTRAIEKLDHGGIDEIVALSRLIGRGLVEGRLRGC
eukprot:6087207-Amphidinium_carterae.2